jgi:hypothetical protein
MSGGYWQYGWKRIDTHPSANEEEAREAVRENPGAKLVCRWVPEIGPFLEVEHDRP